MITDINYYYKGFGKYNVFIVYSLSTFFISAGENSALNDHLHLLREQVPGKN